MAGLIPAMPYPLFCARLGGMPGINPGMTELPCG